MASASPPPPEPFELDGEPHWNVEKILAHEHRLMGNKVKTFFTIKWEDFSGEANTVEPAAMLDNCPDPLREYSESLRAQGRSLEPPGDLLQHAAQAAGRRGRRRAGRGGGAAVTQTNAIRRGTYLSFWPPTQTSRGRR